MRIIGLDGATWDLIKPLAEKGLLPNIEAMMNKGSYGTLHSTVPPLSPVAWTSMVTGQNPGKHGIFDFVTTTEGPKEALRLQFLNGGARKCPAIWDYLSHGGKKSIAMNIPMTYPPESFNGIMISGMDTPDGAEFVSPAAFKEELEQICPEYRIEVPINERLKKTEKFRAQYGAASRAKLKTASYLMTAHDWDFFMVVFEALDRCQHLFLKHYDWNKIQSEADAQQDIVLRFYMEMDRFVGELLQHNGDDVTTLIVSDHGFGPADRSFSVNKWLIAKGFLKLKAGGMTKNRVRRFSKKTLKKVIPNVLLDYLWEFRKKKKRSPRAANLVLQNIDWEATKAYCMGAAPKIMINRDVVKTDEQACELEDILIQQLEAERDPDSGAPIIRRIEKSRDIYTGPHAHRAPEIIMELNRGFWFKHFGLESTPENDQFIEKIDTSGEHLSEGILICKGPHIKPDNPIKQADIIDIVPTVLYLMGEENYKEMDGQIRFEMITREFQEANPVRLGDQAAFEAMEKSAYDSDDEKVIEERLKGLGYL